MFDEALSGKFQILPIKADEVSWIFDQSMSSQSRATHGLQAFTILIKAQDLDLRS